MLSRDRRAPTGSGPESDAGAGREGSTAALTVQSFGLTVEVGGHPLALVRDVELELATGQVLGLVGESGSGKTTLVRAIAGFVPAGGVATGCIDVAGVRVLGSGAGDPRTYRGRIVSVISQDPRQALNPSMRVGSQIAEAVRNATRCGHSAARGRARELLDLVRISDVARRFTQYPFELSGGMRQRVAIAIALACRPDLLLADEPTTALDVTTQLQIVRLLKDLQDEIGMAILMVSHDLALVGMISDAIAVMYAGTVVEYGPTADILDAPRMRYSEALVKCSVGQPHGHREGQLETIDGDPPGPEDRPAGCAFSRRCGAVGPQCQVAEPPSTKTGPQAWARCWYPAPVPVDVRVGTGGGRVG